MASPAHLFQRNWRLCLLVVAGLAVALVLLAPGAIGRLVGDLWVSTMSAVMGLIGALVGA